MLKKLLTVISLSLLSNSALAWQWQDLWATADQQGERLFRQGHAKSAAKLFKNREWKGAAEYRSGDYEAALKAFQAKNTERALYNQGNALAHLGKYEDAINAYDKVLEKNPKNADAKYNRDLLKKLLEQSKKRRQKQQQQAKNKQQKNKNKRQSKDQANNKSNENNEKSRDQKPQQAKKPQDSRKKQAQDLRQPKPQQAQNNQKKQHANNQKKTSERQQAQKQWLRRIPDDPGGFLRQKFLRDYMRRHQNNV